MVEPDTFEEQLTMPDQQVKLSLEIPITTQSQSSSPNASSESSPNPLTDSDALLPNSNASSRTNTRPSSATTLASTSSLLASTRSSLNLSPSSTLSVRFAPLPELTPRRRKSSTPLGMAARGQLMRRRRGQYAIDQMQEIRQAAEAMWTPEQLEAHRARAEEIAARQAYLQASAAAMEARQEEEEDQESENVIKRRSSADDIEDPFSVLGKFVKGAGKTIWKRVSVKDISTSERESEKEKHGKEKDKDRRHSTPRPIGAETRRKSDPGPPPDPTPKLVVPPLPPLPPLSSIRPILANITSNTPNTPEVEETTDPKEEGRVWEEEISASFLNDVGQTETIVDGRPIFSVSTTVDATSTPTIPPVPAQSKRVSTLGKS